MPFRAVDPARGNLVREVASISLDDASLAAERSRASFLEWRETPFRYRASILRRAATLLRDGSESLAHLMAEEMGKPVPQGRSEVEKCAWVLDYYAEHGASFLADQPAGEVEGAHAYWTYQPLGTVLAIMPWNFPLWQVFRAAGPTLMAGNTVLLKHAPSVPGCAQACHDILQEAGLPEGAFQNLFLEVEDVRELLAHDAIRAVTLTGSVRAGRAVAARAGELLKKVVLELGGSDPYVVLSDADVELAANRCVTSRLINTGQSCIAAKRLIVVREHYDDFARLVTERFAAAVMGDPRDPDTDVGPLARADLRDALHEQVRGSVQAGARLRLGGTIPDQPGAWYPPTVLADVGPDMPAWSEELFGPVATLIRAEDDTDALRIANDTTFGLGAALFTADRERGEALARGHLEAGACFVNDFVRSDPRLPFGGVRQSGIGRELSPLGIREFVNAKTVWVAE